MPCSDGPLLAHVVVAPELGCSGHAGDAVRPGAKKNGALGAPLRIPAEVEADALVAQSDSGSGPAGRRGAAKHDARTQQQNGACSQRAEVEASERQRAHLSGLGGRDA